MTVLYPKRFREAAPAGFDGIFEWDFLMPAFEPTKIQPMDLDGLVERRMRFLGFETKDDGVPIKDGQRITLESLVRTQFFTIIVTRGKTAEAIKGWEVWYWGAKSKKIFKKYIEGDSVALTAFVKRWFKWANNRNRAS